VAIEVIRAEVLGFCMGVKAAVHQVLQAADDPSAPRPISTYGPLIHNRLMMEALAEKEVGVVERPEDVHGGTVIVRAHGVPREIYHELRQRAERLIDGTCPRVMHSMRLVKRHADKGGHVILVGDPEHGEVKAVSSYAESVDVIRGIDDLDRVRLRDQTLVIAQTTIAEAEYERVCAALRERNTDIEIVQNICPATKERQGALKKIAESSDAVLVIGGKNSSNTKRLYQLAVQLGKPAWHIEEASELPEECSRYRSIAITAGASTPEWVIDQVEEALRAL
jgi:4-hydroxy-3-methylbut-2-enyl diphosphate reductase